MTEYEQYAHDVISGKVIACQHVKYACRRFLDDFKRDDLIFRKDIVDRVLRFTRCLKHFRGPNHIVGQPLHLEPWQQFITANIFGWYYKDGRRRFKTSYIEVARKNAKTELMAALAMYAMLESPAAQVMLVANSREQASIAFEFCTHFAKDLNGGHNDLKIYRDRIKLGDTGAFVLVCSSDSGKYDGYQPYWCCVDEFHSASGVGDCRNVMISGMIHPNSHITTITTAGFNMSGPCYQLRSVCADVLAGVKSDDRMFAIIYGLDPGDMWSDEKNWIKCSPNLGLSAPIDIYRAECQAAKNNPSEEINFRTKRCNEWVAVIDTWIPETFVNKVRQKLSFEDFRDMSCYVGVDLASVSDLTAVTYCFRKDVKYYFITEYYLPESALLYGSNKDMYRQWQRQGFLNVTPGNVTDYNYITRDMLKKQADYNIFIMKVAYDPYNSVQWAIDSTEEGLPLEEFSQTIFNFNKGTRELERLILSEQCVMDNNEITAYCFRNVTLMADSNNNVKPRKKGTEVNKIDGVISMVESLATAIEYPEVSGDLVCI